jgi:hypothetical protein
VESAGRASGSTPAYKALDLNIPDSAPAHYDDLGALDHQVKAISTASRAPHRFADFLRRSGDSVAKYYSTMRTKDADAFDRVKRAHFDNGSLAVTTDDSGLLWNCPIVRTKHYLKDAGNHKHSPIGFAYLRIPASTTMGFIMSFDLLVDLSVDWCRLLKQKRSHSFACSVDRLVAFICEKKLFLSFEEPVALSVALSLYLKR